MWDINDCVLSRALIAFLGLFAFGLLCFRHSVSIRGRGHRGEISGGELASAPLLASLDDGAPGT